MNIWTLKIISIPIIATINFISGFLPYFFISRKINLLSRKSDDNSSSPTHIALISPSMKRVLSLANFFCGGVFLSTSLIGLLPGVNAKFVKIIRMNPSIYNYPYAGLSLALGFFFVWFLEILVHYCIHCHDHSGHDHTKHTSPTNNNNNNNNNLNVVVTTSLKVSQTDTEDKLLNNCDEDATLPAEESGGHSHVPITGNVLGSVVLTFALGSHSIIEGLGFGVLDDFNSTVNMLVTMAIHESVCAISLGVSIASKKTAIKIASILLIIFSILIPLGIGIGLVVDSGLQKNVLGEIVTAVLQGVAAGTFIYVVFIEILPNEMTNRKDDLWRMMLMIFGFAVIAGMKATHSNGDISGSGNQTLYSHQNKSLYTH